MTDQALVPISGPEIVETVPYRDILAMAETVVRGGLFPGIKTTEQAVTLFLLCQSEGLHPMQALTRYHLIQGRPAMKADAMLAEFMKRGGTIHWIEWTNEACEARFKSKGCPEGVSVRWTIEDAKRAGVTGNPTWTKYPRQMLKARVASDGVRMADPAVNQGRYTPEEVQDIVLDGEAKKVAHEAPERPQEQDLTPILEASLRQEPSSEDSAREALMPQAWEGDPCPECNGEISPYVSMKGVPYYQCSFAHEMFLDLMAKGKSKQFAGTMIKSHFYQVVP